MERVDECAVAAYGMAEATLAEIAKLRINPGLYRARPIDSHCLKHADEHTVVGVTAALRAVAQLSPGIDLGGWGVVAAPRWPGRLQTLAALEKHREEGARSVSPWLIPNLCLHAMSATVSLALQTHGPNLGVGGGLPSVADGLLAGLILQTEQRLPGVWIVLSEWNVEPTSNAQNKDFAQARALALALVPAQSQTAPILSMRPGFPHDAPNVPRLVELIGTLSRPSGRWSCSLDWGMDLILSMQRTVA